MKKKVVLFLLFVSALFPCAAVFGASVFGQLFYPFEKVYTTPTKYFDIVYADRSAGSAAYLSTFADGLYEELTAIMPTRVNGRITVVLAPAPQIENGFSLPFPYTHIVLVDHQTHPVINHKEHLRGLFLHELMHAISLNVKSEFYDGLSRVFGSYLSLGTYTMPEFMIEGVCVSFESLGGFGRVNDPLIAQELRQDILEGKFKTPAQSTGAYDLYPAGDVYYHYGGFFSAYLQKKYGMEKYVQLWENNGGSFIYTLPLVFDAVYPTNFFDEWSMFRDSMAFTGTVDTNLLTLEPACRMLRKNGADDAVVAGGKIVYSDSFDSDVKIYDPVKKELVTLFDGDGELAVSRDEKTLLVTSKTLINGVVTSVTRFYDLSERRFLERRLLDLGSASFYNDLVLAVKARGHRTDLVLVGPDGSVRTLLKGTEKVSFYHPLQLDGNRIVFILGDEGVRKIGMLRLDDGKLFVLEPESGRAADFPVDLRVQEGKVLFSYNNDSSFYKAAVFSGDKLFLQTNNVSGGVFQPMIASDGMYYIGKFSDGKLLLKYPATLGNWNGVTVGAKWKERAPVGEDPAANYPELKRSDYHSLPYLLPHFWVPWLTLGKNYVPDSVGIFTMMYDPFYDNNITLIGTYNFIKQLLNASVDWTSTALPFSLRLNFADAASYESVIGGYYRLTGGYADISYSLHDAPSYHYLLVGGRFSMYLLSYDNGAATAYNWDYVQLRPVWTLYFTYSTAARKYYFYDFKGFSFSGFYDYNLSNRNYKVEATFYYYPSFLPLVFRVDLAASPWPVLNLGSYSSSFGSGHYPSFREYAGVYKNTNRYYIGGEANFPLFNLEIQQGPLLLPIYFNRFYMTAGYRAAYLDPDYYQSVFARAVLAASPIYGAYVPLWNLFFELNYRLNNNTWGIDYSYAYSF